MDGTTGAIISTVYAPSFIPGADDLVFGPDGNLYVAAQGANQVVKFDGTTLAPLGVFASGGGLIQPTGLAFGPDGNLYVGSYNFGASSVLGYDGMTGAFIDTFASGGGLINNELGLAFGPDGNLYASSEVTGSVYRYNGTSGAFIDVFAGDGSPTRLTGIVFMPAAAVPEPTSLALWSIGALCLTFGGLRRRRQQTTAV